MFQLYRYDAAANRKYAIGNPNANRDFLVDCVRKEYNLISVAVNEDGALNVTGHAISLKGVKTAECWLIENIILDKKA